MKLSDPAFKKLQKVWYQKLKDSGFKDEEYFCNTMMIRPEEVSYRMPEYHYLYNEQFYRALGVFIHHYPKRVKYREIIKEFLLTSRIDIFPKHDWELANKYISRNKRKIIDFVRELEVQELEAS